MRTTIEIDSIPVGMVIVTDEYIFVGSKDKNDHATT